jgi:hypothetical protein
MPGSLDATTTPWYKVVGHARRCVLPMTTRYDAAVEEG